MIFTADLHIHSCLSPCGSLEMSPRAIVSQARERGLDLIALTDHNSALNCPAFAAACLEFGQPALFGLEVMTREEVHILCLFSTVAQALELGERIYRLLPDVENDPERMGDQVYVDAQDVILGEVGKYLGNAADLSIADLEHLVLDADGLFIPAHIDRPAFSMTSQLGFLPDGSYTAVEVSRYPPEDPVEGYTIITGSDAHYLESIGTKPFRFNAEERSLTSDTAGNLARSSYEALRDALESGDVLVEV